MTVCNDLFTKNKICKVCYRKATNRLTKIKHELLPKYEVEYQDFDVKPPILNYIVKIDNDEEEPYFIREVVVSMEEYYKYYNNGIFYTHVDMFDTLKQEKHSYPSIDKSEVNRKNLKFLEEYDIYDLVVKAEEPSGGASNSYYIALDAAFKEAEILLEKEFEEGILQNFILNKRIKQKLLEIKNNNISYNHILEELENRKLKLLSISPSTNEVKNEVNFIGGMQETINTYCEGIKKQTIKEVA